MLSKNDLLNNLSETFFRTGKHPTRYVKITYNFLISDPVNSSNETEENFDYNCTSFQNVYIWSESPLYLLGPKPLFWFSLFAINVPEASVTIELPCLCRSAYNRLLSWLTYMVSTMRCTYVHVSYKYLYRSKLFQLKVTAVTSLWNLPIQIIFELEAKITTGAL